MQSTLLLASSYEPIDVISWKNAIRLMTLGKAEIIEEYDKDIRSMYLVIKMPAVVRLVSSFRKRKSQVKFSRVNIYTRDKYRCQYCGIKGGMKKFTFDHVLPRSRGGKTCWTNITTCCRECNSKKRDRTPEEAGMKLIKRPERPKWLPSVTIRLSKQPVPGLWNDYLYWHSSLIEEESE